MAVALVNVENGSVRTAGTRPDLLAAPFAATMSLARAHRAARLGYDAAAAGTVSWWIRSRLGDKDLRKIQ